MNLPNLITLSRIPTMFVIVGLMYGSWRGSATLAFIVFLLAAIGDWLDGYLARKQNIVSNFGKFMDALTDKVLVLGIMVALVEIYDSKLILVLVLLTICREFLISGMRMLAATKGVVVAAERGGKIKTVLQLVAVSFMLLLPALQKDWAAQLPFDIAAWHDKLYFVGVGIFAVATALTVSSGASYVSKYRKIFDDLIK